MPNIVNSTIISEGTSKAIIHFYLESDGNEGEFTNRVLWDPAVDFNVLGAQQRNQIDGSLVPAKVTILQVWFALSWFDATLSFNGVTPLPKIVLARDADFNMDLRGFAGIADLVPYENMSDGKLLISTKDFAPLGSNGMIVLELRKN